MKLHTHTCKVTGCGRVIPAFLLLCPDHWDMVPAALRREVMAARHRMAAWEPGGANQYWAAADRAVAAVQEKQERKAASRPSGSLFT